VRARLVDWVTDGIVWVAALATASGTGLLLAEIFDH